ncbi:hypothetical protein ACROYT_G033520 [Oculina patagonica]
MENFTSNQQNNMDNMQVLLCANRSSGKHWLFFSAISFFIAITAASGNTLILIALHKNTSLHPPSKLLYRCLAVTDLLAGLIAQPSTALYNISLVAERRLTDFCYYSGAASTVSFTILSAISLLTMTAISVDRLLALLLGLRYRHIVTLRRVRALVFFFWIASITLASTSFWEYLIAKIYNYILILLCIIVSALCYLKIFLVFRNHHVSAHQHQEETNGGGIPLNIARYRKTVSTAMWVEGTLVACYLPYSTVIAVITSYGSSPILDVFWKISVTLVYLNSSLNPILYCWKIREVRQEVKNTIRQLFCLSN